MAYLRKFLDANREHLWAEALFLHRAGNGARLPDELGPACRRAANDGHRRNRTRPLRMPSEAVA